MVSIKYCPICGTELKDQSVNFKQLRKGADFLFAQTPVDEELKCEKCNVEINIGAISISNMNHQE